MKQKSSTKKLVINKITITNLTTNEQAAIRGGDKDTVHGRTCDLPDQADTVHGRTCDLPQAAAADTVHGRTCDQPI